MVKELACRKCKCIGTSKICPNPACRSSDLTSDWDGIVVVANPEESKIAKTLKITEKGKYALKVT
jgi:DNA-directed RNA polymerase subunit E"